ncbi:12027_t:CDS:2 [Ambispora gerdemannii]|uniref:12027_t:CDS:1 n=1 Tax=Ambispora gerdemannii TaxID=144530 RepID=A0A9N9GVQ3_9GLOM|nr:12027_t:CDS:2 [Ambispora gerdemannii]
MTSLIKRSNIPTRKHTSSVLFLSVKHLSVLWFFTTLIPRVDAYKPAYDELYEDLVDFIVSALLPLGLIFTFKRNPIGLLPNLIDDVIILGGIPETSSNSASTDPSTDSYNNFFSLCLNYEDNDLSAKPQDTQ